LLAERYRIDHVLGDPGSFGITYKAWDESFQIWVALKEFLPMECAGREESTRTVMPQQGNEPLFERLLADFMEEGRKLVSFKHENIVRALNLIEANSTAYLAMEYEEGETLSSYLQREQRPLTEQECKDIFRPLLRGLAYLHGKEFLHRDIKPGNIYLRQSGEPLLIDFGSARQVVSGGDNRLTMLYTPGYAAPEQYSMDASRQGPWTDLYSIGATMYRCIFGELAVDAMSRKDAAFEGEVDPLISATTRGAGQFSEPFLALIDELMKVDPRDRRLSAGDAESRLAGQAVVEPSTKLVGGAERTRRIAPGAVHDESALRDETGPLDGVQDQGASVAGVVSGLAADQRIGDHPTTARGSKAGWGLPGVIAAATAAVGLTVAAVWSIVASLDDAPEPGPTAGTPPPVNRADRTEERHISETTSVAPQVTASALEDPWPAGKALRDTLPGGASGPSMVIVPAGQASLGTDKGEPDESPSYSTAFATPFAISVGEITFEDYAVYANATAAPLPDDAGWGRGQRPVVGVSWQDAVDYAGWLSERTGESYRLPSESEWEYVARAGSETETPEPGSGNWGQPITTGGTEPQGSYPPNGFGVQDMAGNVWEWTADCWNPDHTGANSDGNARERGDCDRRVLRGGAWNSEDERVRFPNRSPALIETRSRSVGFRLVRELHR
jgi:formylglycine-generating enzyme required for sulfatase activity